MEPGTTSARIPSLTLPVFAIFAASRRSEIRPLVQEPMKATSIGMPEMFAPAEKSM